MTTDAVKKIQGKIFRGDATPTQIDETRDTGLAIVIPKPPPTPVPPPKLSSSTGQKQADDAFPKSHRDRLAQKLAGEYRGAERHRLLQDEKRERHWKKWGPYLSDRQWVRSLLICAQVLDQSLSCTKATVREDYSADGNAWAHFPHEHARSRAYRWGEDGIAGISDNHQRICFGLSFWNGEDPILKERLFGVTGHQGNHGEDVKELYYYLDSTPTHSYMKFLYKYPQRRYPYEELVAESVNRTRDVTEHEILDTNTFDEDRYWDIFVEVISASCLRYGQRC